MTFQANHFRVAAVGAVLAAFAGTAFSAPVNIASQTSVKCSASSPLTPPPMPPTGIVRTMAVASAHSPLTPPPMPPTGLTGSAIA